MSILTYFLICGINSPLGSDTSRVDAFASIFILLEFNRIPMSS